MWDHSVRTAQYTLQLGYKNQSFNAVLCALKLMLYTKVIAVYFEIHTKHINALWMLNLVVYVVTSRI